MPSYSAPVEDTLFVLNEVLNINQYNNLPGFADATPDMIEAILTEGAKLCEEVTAPLNKSGDSEGCILNEDGTVSVPKGFKEAYDAYCEGGWNGLAMPEEFGGQNLPAALGSAIGEYMNSANVAFAMYPGLTQGAVAALLAHGSQEQKEIYAPKMIAGQWTGTMNLTEPHCGTDLGLLRTKAVPNEDGSYAISGQKIFISAGEHEMSENIIHLVIARIEGAPEGTKGISLFVVPKYIVNEDGSIGERNALSCGALEEKMGIHGNSTCVMNYDGAKGWLVGTENKGLSAMFTMMNEARLGVGIQGLAISEVAYQNAVEYAKDRRQGRALSGAQEPDKSADALIVHPDIRRILMTIKSINEAGRAFALWTSLNGDLSHRGLDDETREAADDMMGLLTPVLKGVLTDKGFDNAVMAQQVFGGHGYIQEWGMEQFVRDSRIAMIYEGANGIQALDLVGRKLPRNGGRAIQAFFKEVGSFISSHKDDDKMADYTKPLSQGLSKLQEATMWLMSNAMAKPENAGAASTDYMHLTGLVVLGYMWAKMAKVANDKLEAGTDNPKFYENKLLTAKFFMERIMPECNAHMDRISTGCETMMAMETDAF
jgi:alkylation response protein AidB-like acyl-CoA dehydrogenase